MRSILSLLTAILLVCGCGSDVGSKAKTEAEKRKALEESAFGDMAGTLDAAGDVEQLNADRKKKLDEAIAESESH